VPEVK
jgi:hypothetical protein